MDPVPENKITGQDAPRRSAEVSQDILIRREVVRLRRDLIVASNALFVVSGADPTVVKQWDIQGTLDTVAPPILDSIRRLEGQGGTVTHTSPSQISHKDDIQLLQLQFLTSLRGILGQLQVPEVEVAQWMAKNFPDAERATLDNGSFSVFLASTRFSCEKDLIRTFRQDLTTAVKGLLVGVGATPEQVNVTWDIESTMRQSSETFLSQVRQRQQVPPSTGSLGIESATLLEDLQVLRLQFHLALRSILRCALRKNDIVDKWMLDNFGNSANESPNVTNMAPKDGDDYLYYVYEPSRASDQDERARTHGPAHYRDHNHDIEM